MGVSGLMVHERQIGLRQERSSKGLSEHINIDVIGFLVWANVSFHVEASLYAEPELVYLCRAL